MGVVIQRVRIKYNLFYLFFVWLDSGCEVWRNYFMSLMDLMIMHVKRLEPMYGLLLNRFEIRKLVFNSFSGCKWKEKVFKNTQLSY